MNERVKALPVGIEFFQDFISKNLPRNETKEKVIKYAKEHGVDQTVIMTVAGAANCKIDYRRWQRKEMGICVLYLMKSRKKMKRRALLKRALILAFLKKTFWKDCKISFGYH